MKKQETRAILDKIRFNYENFYVDNNITDKWYETLKEYDYADVMNKLIKYIEENDTKPTLEYLVKFLRTEKEKNNSVNLSNYYVDCNLCRKTIKFDDYDNHYEKCLLINGIIAEYKKRGTIVKYEDMDRYSYDSLNDKYGKWFETARGITYDL